MNEEDKTADFEKPAEQPSLQQLADQGIEALLTSVGKALPSATGQVGVAAFNSSI